MARLQGFEPRAHGLEGRCSILLSYRRMIKLINGAGEGNRTLATGLEGQGSTTELHPQTKDILYRLAVNVKLILKFFYPFLRDKH